MAQYPAPIYEEVFNVKNFSNLNSFQYMLYNKAKVNVANTFLRDVFINANMNANDTNLGR